MTAGGVGGCICYNTDGLVTDGLIADGLIAEGLIANGLFAGFIFIQTSEQTSFRGGVNYTSLTLIFLDVVFICRTVAFKMMLNMMNVDWLGSIYLTCIVIM